MTCIVGLVERGKVYMGCDSAGTACTGFQVVREDPKVFRIGKDMLVGFCASFRMRDVLQYHFEPPKYRPKVHGDERRYMAVEFVDAARKVFKEAGILRVIENVDSATDDSSFMVGWRGRLFQVEEDFQVGESSQPFAAIGSGAEIALGALYATHRQKIAPTLRVQKALEAAEQYNAGCRGPNRVFTL